MFCWDFDAFAGDGKAIGDRNGRMREIPRKRSEDLHTRRRLFLPAARGFGSDGNLPCMREAAQSNDCMVPALRAQPYFRPRQKGRGMKTVIGWICYRIVMAWPHPLPTETRWFAWMLGWAGYYADPPPNAELRPTGAGLSRQVEP